MRPRDEMGFVDHFIAQLVGHTLSGMTSRYGEVRDATVLNAANDLARIISGHMSQAWHAHDAHEPSNVSVAPEISEDRL